ncbi:uncharacterized protein LOC124689142 [Lolium rigidum]|uniref:uncharacterized protein LOC124689142 n=1 Tax=Lolium rigidum TaxID=89674 RepID=UPI001F5CA23B|nr:uncharacterized protein LOC124689142 [Lolium rigidum]
MSSLLRSPATCRALSAVSTRGPQGASFRHAPSVAAPAFGGEWGATVRRGLAFPTLPRRHLGGPPLPGVEATTPSPAQIDLKLQQAKEVEQLVQKSVDELIELYTEMRTRDHGYFERFLSKCGIPRSKFRDDFVFGCKLAAIFAASGVIPYLLPVI